MMPRSALEGERAQGQLSDRPSAVALSYTGRDNAPLVLAKGYGDVAESIVRRARESGLYVHASPDLVRLLMHVGLDQHIPPALYGAVAEVLAWIYQIETMKAAS